MGTLVLAEQKHGKLQPNTLHAVSAAKQLGGGVTVLVAGKGVGDAAQAASKVEGVQKVSIFIANYADCNIYSILLFIKRDICVLCTGIGS